MENIAHVTFVFIINMLLADSWVDRGCFLLQDKIGTQIREMMLYVANGIG